MHAQAYLYSPHANLVGISDKSGKRAKKLGGELGVFSTTGYMDLIKKGVEVVSVATPPFTHFDITRFFMEAGVHTLVEKPMTLDLGEAERLVELDREGESKLMVGFSERFPIGFHATKDRINQIGKPYLARGWWMHRASSPSGWIWDVKKWRGDS